MAPLLTTVTLEILTVPNKNYGHNFLYIGDKASASNVAFLKRYGITHVLNAAEGIEEGLVDLNPDHYAGTGISYLGFPLWDAPGNLPYTMLCTKIGNCCGRNKTWHWNDSKK